MKQQRLLFSLMAITANSIVLFPRGGARELPELRVLKAKFTSLALRVLVRVGRVKPVMTQ